ncbi:hypothetical protein BaRGS_00033010, partial [Batillaria attramentaria]
FGLVSTDSNAQTNDNFSSTLLDHKTPTGILVCHDKVITRFQQKTPSVSPERKRLFRPGSRSISVQEMLTWT